MRVHPRTHIVNEARRELEETFIEVQRKYELTAVEALAIAHKLPDMVIRAALRHERHGDNPEGKGADEA